MDLTRLENIHADIETVYEVVKAFQTRVDGRMFGIKILRTANGRYIHELSHHYQGADAHEHPFGSSEAYDSVEEAAVAAHRRLTFGYRSTDEGGRWVENDQFHV